MFQFHSELESEEEGGKRERVECLLFPEKTELLLTLASLGDNPRADEQMNHFRMVWFKPPGNKSERSSPNSLFNAGPLQEF